MMSSIKADVTLLLQRPRKPDHPLINNVAIIHGPFGMGSTKLLQAIAEAAAEQEKRVLITTSTNSVADSIISKLEKSEHMVVRAHSWLGASDFTQAIA
jgi:chromosomal replication initiation ATPase DnaA